jgi:hypothetical protein
MSMQDVKQQQQKPPSRFSSWVFWARNILGPIVLIGLGVVLVAWILSFGRVIDVMWATIFTIIMGVLGVVFTFCQWIYAILSDASNYLRPRRTMGESISLPEQRQAFLERLAVLQVLMQAIS